MQYRIFLFTEKDDKLQSFVTNCNLNEFLSPCIPILNNRPTVS